MQGYKGFDKDFCCRGMQYEVGKTYELDGELKLCESGFHFCDTPLAVFEYYPPAENRFALVEATSNVISDDNEEHKFCTNEITIIKELSLAELIQCAEKLPTNTGNRSAATNTGDCSAATNTGNRSVATNTGNCSAATNTGNRSAATNTGNCSAATNTGDCSAATNTGNRSAATNTGDCSAATNTGNRSAATNTGNCSAASVTGERSIAIAFGINSKAKGSLGSWIVISEWHNFEPYDVQCFKVDGVKIKPDTFYTLKDGLPVEMEDDDN